MQPAIAVSIAEAARLVGLSKGMIRIYLRTGRIRGTRCGRRVIIPVSELLSLAQDGGPSRYAA